jgi:hypothetical protein
MEWLESKLLRIAVGLGLLVMAAGFGYVKGNAHGKAMTAAQIAAIKLDAASAEASAQRAARSAEQAQAARNVKIDAAYQRGLTDAKAAADRVVADLRDGNLRLRAQWRGCEAAARVSTPAAGEPGADAAADGRAEDPSRALRDASAGRLVRTGAEADALIKALQARIRSDLETVNGKP